MTPFRYPGAKTKLLPEILARIPVSSDTFCDLFVGGGSVALAVAAREPKRTIVLNDADRRVAAFWAVVAEGGRGLEDLLSLLLETPTLSVWQALRARRCHELGWLAYQALFFNRTCYNGILDSGPIGGMAQTGKYRIACRFNAAKLIAKVQQCHQLLAGRTGVFNKDASDDDCPQGFLYLDPPYYHQGDALYSSQCDHQGLADNLRDDEYGSWLLSYDDCPEVRAMYTWAHIEELRVRYCIKNAWKERTELAISPLSGNAKDLG